MAGEIRSKRLDKLPGWAVDNRTSVLREAEPYRNLTPAQRWEMMASLCRGAARQLAGRDDYRSVLDYSDPLPESTVIALARLRSERKPRA